MNKDIYPFVAELIEAYERGLINSIASDPKDSNAKALFASPLQAMETSLIVAETGFATSIFESKKSEEEKQSEASVVKSEEGYKNYYEECSNEVADSNRPFKVINEDVYLNDEESNPNFEVSVEPLKALGLGRRRIRKKMKDYAFLRGSSALDKYLSSDDGEITIGKLKTNFGIEKCLDCLIDIELEFITPSLEWIFSLKKLLERLKEVLQLIKNAMDPTTVFGPICAFLNAIKENGLCPRNLPAINLLLPTLFTKYSFDLIKIRLSWTTLLGPIMKGVIGSVVSLLENIPKLTNPFFDCVINAFTNLNKFIKIYLASADKIMKNINDTVYTFDKMIARAARLGEVGLEGLGFVDKDNDLSVMEAKLDYLNNTLSGYPISREETSFNDFVNEFVNSNELIDSSSISKRGLLIEFANYCVTSKKVVVADKEDNIHVVSLESLHEYLVRSRQGRSVENISYQDLQNIVEILNSNYIQELSEDTPIMEERALLQQSIHREQINSKDRLRIRQKLFEGSGLFSEDQGINIPDFNTDRFISGAQNLDVNGSIRTRKTNPKEEIKKTFYGVQSKINYIEPKSTLLGSDWATTNLLNDYKNSDINKLIEDLFIKKTKEAKKYVNDLVQKIIYAFKSLERFMDQYITLDVQFAGQILELLHIIRFIKTIYRLIKNGFPDCKSIVDKPETVARMLSNDPIIFRVGVDPTRNAVLEDQTKQLIIETTDNQYATNADMEACDKGTGRINLNDENLDSLYAQMLSEFQ